MARSMSSTLQATTESTLPKQLSYSAPWINVLLVMLYAVFRLQQGIKLLNKLYDPAVIVALTRLDQPWSLQHLKLLPGFIPGKILSIMAVFSQNIPKQKERIILFGGQGSPSLFSHAAVAVAEHNCKASVSAATLASKCHAAFLEEYASLSTQEHQVLGIDIHKFHHLDNFLHPRQEYHRNGLVQSMTICLYQLIQYVAVVEAEVSIVGNGCFTEQIMETTGLCSGLIPAAVVASSQSLSDVVRFGTEALRLSFWTACRSILEGRKQNQTLTDDDAWSIVVKGLSRSQVEQRLDQFSQQVSVAALGASYIQYRILHPGATTVSSNISYHFLNNDIIVG